MTRVRAVFRVGALACALGVGSLALSACDASPYAATVNGSVITVNQLNSEMAGWAANRTWVEGFDKGNSTAQGGNGATVVGSGGPGTYSTTFAGDILADLVATKAIDQYLVAHSISLTQDQLVASQAINEYIRGASWAQFTPGIRAFQIRQLAEEGALTPVPTSTSNLQAPYGDIQPYLFSSICVYQETTFDKSHAQAIIASGAVMGGEICYSQTSLEAQPAALQAAVRALAKPNDLTPAIATSYGYVVAQLGRRTTPGLSPGVQQVLTAALGTPSEVSSVVAAAKVQVNPRYGTWSKGQITPPKPPPSQ
ncbi:MAG: hypothetical protein KGQ66_07720 [Acidobacteriota bacterium]|nr:hypothetical protein [Acidobacteriota bacterium]